MAHPAIRDRAGLNDERDELCLARSQMHNRCGKRNPLFGHAFDQDIDILFIGAIVVDPHLECGAAFRQDGDLIFLDGNFELVVLPLLGRAAIHSQCFRFLSS